MAKKITDETPIAHFEDDWGGTYSSGANAGKEWGKTHSEVERVIKKKVADIEDKMIADIQLGDVSQDGTMVELNFFNSAGDKLEDLSIMIPAAQDIGEIIQPVVTTELLSEERIKLGDTISLRWGYDCIRKYEGASERANYPAQSVVVTVKIGTTTVYTETYTQVAVGTLKTITLGQDVIDRAGMVSIGVVATTQIDEETKTSRGSKSVTVITMNLATTFNPASQLVISNGYTDGQTISIPYTYTVPTNTTLRTWLDGELYATGTISDTGRNYVYLSAFDLSPGRHNVQMIAESAGLLSNAVSVDFLKAGGNADYLGVRLKTDVSQLSDMPFAHTYSSTAIPLSVEQFGDLQLDIAAWNNSSVNSIVIVSVDGTTTQTLMADRYMKTVTQHFEASGNHRMVISIGDGNPTAYMTFDVNVIGIAGVTETETVGYRTKLSATGRNNGELNPADWGGITTFTGVDWRTNGWNRGSDNVDALLLTNGATAEIDVKPFVLDATDGDYSIQSRGMTLEMEFMISQVIERGATVISCLYDNDGNGYPMGIKVTTEEAGLYFGGVEEITTAEDLVDEDGNYIDYEGNIVDEENKVPLIITRPYGVSMNIALDRWVHLTFVVQPVSGGYGLGMLFINGVLSRANRYTGTLRQTIPSGIIIDSDKADVRMRMLRYYRVPLIADEAIDNWIISRPTAAMVLNSHENNVIGDFNNTTDSDGNIAIDHDTLLSRGRGILTIIRSDDSGNGLSDMFTCTDKKQNFHADLVRWEPPRDGNGNNIGEGFEARHVRLRIQGTSSVKYPYKNLRIYLTTQQGSTARSLSIGGVDVTDTASGYPLKGSDNSIAQAVLCAKTDFVDSSLVLNTGGAHLFNDIMHVLNLDTPPQQYDSRIRQAIDGIPCDVYGGTDEFGALTYYGQFVLNNEKSKSTKIFGMEGVKDGNNTVDFRAYNNGSPVIDTKPIALEALTNSSPMTLFQPAGSADSSALANQLAAEFDNGFEFNCPEDAVWATIGMGDYSAWGGAQTAIKRLMGWIYDCMTQTAGVVGGTMTIASPDYGTSAGWSAASMAKWVCTKFKSEASQYFVVNHLLTYYLFTDYWASVDQRAKNILWRTWDGLIWYATYYDGDTAQSIRNDAFMVYLYNMTRDTYDNERSKFAYEGHSSWLWCLVLANFEDELKQCATNLRNQLTTQVMLNEFNNVMQGNWSERQYNKSGKLKYIDTIQTMNYVYTLTGNRELHRTQFLRDRAKLLDARYNMGEYNGDVITFTVVRQSTDTPSSLTLRSGDLYYYGYKLNGIWLQGPTRVSSGDTITLNFTQTLATNDPLMLGGASCVKELDFSAMGSQLNGTVGLSLCTMLTKLVMQASNGVSNAPLTLGNTSKLEYVDITGQTAVHTGTAGVFDISKHTHLTTFLAGGTNLTRVILPEGAPLTTLTLPSTLTTLTLRYLPNLTQSGLTLQGTSNITSLNFGNCPNLSWYALLQQCTNIRTVRIEGISGEIHSEDLRIFMTGYDATAADPTANMVYHGLTADGIEQTYPALIGSVKLTTTPNDYEAMRTFFALCGLEITGHGDYSIYRYDDLETDPANITCEDSRTGYGYPSSETYQSGTKEYYIGNYECSGHVNLIHDKCQLCAGIINPETGKMHVTKLSKTNLFETADGDEFDPTDANGEGYDVFLYLPHYWYKGVNDYKNAKKYFIVSANDTCPMTDATHVRYAMTDILYSSGHAIDNSLYVDGYGVDDILAADSTCNVYKVLVEGNKRVRFPGIEHETYSFVFVDDEENIISINTLSVPVTETNPTDFINNMGDYDFRDIPSNAKYLYFTCKTTAASRTMVLHGVGVIVTNSDKIVDVEPDWVEHKAELIGIYPSSIPNTVPHSLSGKSVRYASGTSNATWTYGSDGNPTAVSSLSYYSLRDQLNLALLRNATENVVNGQYRCTTYETSKDLANLMMLWFGTRDVNILVGRGASGSPSTGIMDNIAFGDTSYIAQSQHNKIWGLERWGSGLMSVLDNVVYNASSFLAYKNTYKRTNDVITAIRVNDTRYIILKQDGTERIMFASPTLTSGAANVSRVRFGRYCDIMAGSYSTDTTYTTGYTDYQTAATDRQKVVFRSGSGSSASRGIICMDLTGTGAGFSYVGSRLTFFGEIENEGDLID